MKFAFIAAEKAFPVAVMCRVFGVTRQGYYAYLKRNRARQPVEAELQAQVKRAFAEGRGAYGSPRVLQALRDVGGPAAHRTETIIDPRCQPTRRRPRPIGHLG